MILERYTPDMAAAWDAFADASRNATFLHSRGYMDYHADRFADHSLLARDDAGRLIAVLPANAEPDGTLASHRGLTYGGWLTDTRRVDAAVMLDIFDALTGYMRKEGFGRLVYRPVPHIYHRYPADDDIYALWRMGAHADAMGASTAVDLRAPALLDRGTRSAVNAAVRSGAVFGESADWAGFWQLLGEVLRERHDARPVHTIEEMLLLHSRFPENIRLYTASREGRTLAGVVVYRCGRVAHAQYIAAGSEARALRLLPALYVHIMRQECNGFDYFDFGISTEQSGRVLNESLNAHKARLGGRCVVYPSFTLEL